jgi:diaminohydroxyphosphoribosylaminopyrimidine deaminase/5-amino-6-(5-phosphoribosylamino)uracil reductase
MTVRHVPTPRQPKRAAIDPGFDITEDAALLEGGEVYIFTAVVNQAKADRLAARNVQVVLVPEGEPTPSRPRPRVDMQAMMQWLAAQGHNEVHVEAGEGLNGALLAADCIDELLVYMAPLLLGEGKSIAQVPVLQQLDDAQRFQFIDVKLLGADVRLRARVSEHWRALMKSIHLIP